MLPIGGSYATLGMYSGMLMPGVMGPGAGLGFSFGVDSFGRSHFGMQMGVGIPFGGFGMGMGMGFGMGMGLPGMGFGMGVPMMGFGLPWIGFCMDPLLLLLLLMWMQSRGCGCGGPVPWRGGAFPGFGGAPGAFAGIGYPNVKVTRGNPRQWYFQHGKYKKTKTDFGWIQEGGNLRIYYNQKTRTGYIYEKVGAAAAAACGSGAAAAGVSGWRLKEIRTDWGGKAASPIILDLDGNGRPDVQNGEWKPHAEKGDIGARKVWFDLDGDGRKELTEWMGNRDGLLLKLSDEQIEQYKRTGRLEVSGRELYGDQGGKYADGYEKMRKLSDANRDGRLSGDELKNHYVWQDLNQDGIVDRGELTSVQERGITEISATHGGDYRSSYVQNGQQRRTWDWWPTTWN